MEDFFTLRFVILCLILAFFALAAAAGMAEMVMELVREARKLYSETHCMFCGRRLPDEHFVLSEEERACSKECVETARIAAGNGIFMPGRRVEVE